VAKFRPSSMDRILRCKGSVARCAAAPKREAGEAAREGSAAHKVAELCLLNKQDAAEYVDRGIDIGDGKGKIFLDDDGCEAVQLYLDTVRAYAAAPGATFLVEQKLSLGVFGTTPELIAKLSENTGTADAVILNEPESTLTIVDLKFGRGVVVTSDSYQLRDYGVMAVGTYQREKPWTKIRIVVVQPRLPREEDRIKIAEFTPEELQDFLFMVWTAMNEAEDPNAPLVPGEKQCRWCDGAPGCPALQDYVRSSALAVMAANPMTALSPSTDAPPENAPGFDPAIVRDATPEQLRDWLDRRDLVEGFFKAVEQRVASMLTLIPGSVPDYKMVSRAGNRKFIEQEPEKLEAQLIGTLGLTREQIYGKPKLLGPSPIEKLLKGAELKAKLGKLVERPLGAPTLVKDTDGRAALPGVFVGSLPPLQHETGA